MPKCFVKSCSHSTGQKSKNPEVSLHHFPKEIALIQEWLRLAGVEDENLDFFSMEILEDKRSDKYRMCSAHFTKDAYVMKGVRRFLKVGATPCIFPERSVLDYSPTATFKKIVKQVYQSPIMAPVGLPLQTMCACGCHAPVRARLVNASTQTEESDFLTLSLLQSNSRLGFNRQIDNDYSQMQRVSGPKPSAIYTSLATNIAPPSYRHAFPVKHFEKTQQMETEENHKDNNVLDSNTRSDLIQEKPIIPSEESPLNKISVDSWKTVEIKQENTPKQCSIPSEKPRFANKLPLFDPIPDQNNQRYVTGIKREDKNEYGSLANQKPKSNIDTTPLEKPIQWKVMPMFAKKPKELEIVSKPPHFDIITAENQIQKENHTFHLEDVVSKRTKHDNNKSPFFDATTNRDEQRKEIIEYKHLHAKAAKSNVDHASIYHKAKEWENLQKWTEGPCHDTEDSTDTDNSADEDSPSMRPKRKTMDPNASANLTDPKRSKFLHDMDMSLSLQNYSKDKKYVVFESSLDVLLVNMRCQQKPCTSKIKEFDKRTAGSLLLVFGTCGEGHYTKLWESQPCVNGTGAGNVLLTALLVLTGLDFAKIKQLCDLIGLQIFSESSLHQYRHNVFPVIEQWMQDLK